MTACLNCQRSTNTDRLRAGRCMSCYRYYRKHGEERPAERMRRSPKEPRKLEALALETGMSMSEVLRSLVENAEIKSVMLSKPVSTLYLKKDSP